MKEVTKEARTFDGGITPEQVEAMKSKHRKVFRVDIVDGEDTHVGYFKRNNIERGKVLQSPVGGLGLQCLHLSLIHI